MSDIEILKLIKDKRHNAYCDYEFNLLLNMQDDNRQSFRARKEHIKILQSNIKVYDELISMIESK